MKKSNDSCLPATFPRPYPSTCSFSRFEYLWCILPECPGLECVGAGNQAIAALQSLQEAGERVVVRVVAGQAGALMATLTRLDWLPDHAPRSNTPSVFVTDIIAFVKVLPAIPEPLLPSVLNG